MESNYIATHNGTVLERKVDDTKYIYMFLFLMPFLMICPMWFIATFIWLPMKEQGEKDAQKAEQVEQAGQNIKLLYEEYYPVPLTSPDAQKETRMYHLVMEKTPKGFVIMRYNKVEEAFEYWSDTSIDYKYLDTVARKYAWTWNCLGVYINRCEMLHKKVANLKIEIEKNKKKIAEEQTLADNSNENTVVDEEENLFAVLKRVKRKNKATRKLKIIKDDLVCDVANKFIRRGKLKDPKIWITAEKDQPKNKQPFKWTDWKFLTQKNAP